VAPPDTISIALSAALSLTAVNLMAMAPAAFAVAVNDSATALYRAPVVAKTSKPVSTVALLMLTLKLR
jgi:hypothetical protein